MTCDEIQGSIPKKSESQSSSILELIHSDLCGPMKNETLGKKRYFLTFTDDYSRYTTIYLLHSKDEVADRLKDFIKLVKTKFGKVPKVLRSDNGKEYRCRETQNILRKYGIQFQTSVGYSPEQNGIAERKNRTLVEAARCMLFDAGLPKSYWGEAVNTANYTINRLPTSATGKTPLELWSGRKPDFKYFRRFGCEAFIHIPKEKRTKWDPVAEKGIFVGYSDESKGYRIINPITNKITTSRTVQFSEFSEKITQSEEKPNVDEVTVFYPDFHDKVNVEEQTHEEDQQSAEEKDKEEERRQEDDGKKNNENQERRVSTRQNKGVPPDRLGLHTSTDKCDEPTSWNEMLKLPENERIKWEEAVKEELKSLKEKGTWILTDLPEGKKPLGCKWVFKKKYTASGELERYKARLVAQGYLQKYGVDYDCTFAPVNQQSTLRIFLTIAASKGMEVRQYDIKTAFLNGDISEDIYLKIPEGYEKEGNGNALKLIKSLYGLKQAARAWNEKLDTYMKENMFVPSKADPCLYVKIINGTYCYVLVYVDDLLVTHKDINVVKEIGNLLDGKFGARDLGEIKSFLGIRISRNKKGNFYLDQTKKIEEIIEKYGLTNAQGCGTPIVTSYLQDNGEENQLSSDEKYREAIGSLLYISTVTRPDVSFAVGVLARRTSCPRQKDWNGVKRVIKYLKKTKNLRLKLGKEDNLEIHGFVDADWAGDTTDRKSTSGYIFQIGSSSILWGSKKQTCTATSTAEAEFISASMACGEAEWLRKLMEDFGYLPQGPTVLKEDNQGCLKIAMGENVNHRSRNIAIKYHNVKDLVNKNVVKLEYCEGSKMVADCLTKPLPEPRLQMLRQAIGLLPSGGVGGVRQ